MLALLFQFAAVEPLTERIHRVTQGSGLTTRDLLLATLAGSLLALAIFIGTYLHLHKKRQRAEARDFARLTSRSTDSGVSDDGTRRRRRRRKRAHRPRNPSLQQTGGLPPPRPEDQPPKY